MGKWFVPFGDFNEDLQPSGSTAGVASPPYREGDDGGLVPSSDLGAVAGAFNWGAIGQDIDYTVYALTVRPMTPTGSRGRTVFNFPNNIATSSHTKAFGTRSVPVP
jgi:hypothetical protein